MTPHLSPPPLRSVSRRELLWNAGAGFAGLALTHLLDLDDLLHASPVFDDASLDMGNGKTLRIVAKNNSRANAYIQSATLNGRPWSKPWFRHDDVKDGATFVFTMGPQPNKAWGAAPDAAPPSMSRKR